MNIVDRGEMFMELKVGMNVTATAVTGELVEGEVTNILTHVVILEAGVDHHVVKIADLIAEGYML